MGLGFLFVATVAVDTAVQKCVELGINSVELVAAADMSEYAMHFANCKQSLEAALHDVDFDKLTTALQIASLHVLDVEPLNVHRRRMVDELEPLVARASSLVEQLAKLRSSVSVGLSAAYLDELQPVLAEAKELAYNDVLIAKATAIVDQARTVSHDIEVELQCGQATQWNAEGCIIELVDTSRLHEVIVRGESLERNTRSGDELLRTAKLVHDLRSAVCAAESSRVDLVLQMAAGTGLQNAEIETVRHNKQLQDEQAGIVEALNHAVREGGVCDWNHDYIDSTELERLLDRAAKLPLHSVKLEVAVRHGQLVCEMRRALQAAYSR